jgi:hypothetical protein
MHLPVGGRFWLWAVAGALITFSVVAAASIGLFILPFAALATAFVARSTQRRAEALGVLLGAGSICFLIAGLQVGDEGGADARPWFIRRRRPRGHRYSRLRVRDAPARATGLIAEVG